MTEATCCDAECDAWDRQAGESAVAYAQFRCYLELEPEERGQRAAWTEYRRRRAARGEALSDRPGGEFIANHRRWRWPERARAYDNEVQRKERRALQRRRTRLRGEMADLGASMRRKAAAAVRLMTAIEQRVRNEHGQDVVVLETKITPMEAAKLAEVGTRLELLALGEPTERTHVGEDTGAPFGVGGPESAKDEIRRRLEAMRARRLAIQSSGEAPAESAEQRRNGSGAAS